MTTAIKFRVSGLVRVAYLQDYCILFIETLYRETWSRTNTEYFWTIGCGNLFLRFTRFICGVPITYGFLPTLRQSVLSRKESNPESSEGLEMGYMRIVQGQTGYNTSLQSWNSFEEESIHTVYSVTYLLSWLAYIL